MNKLNQLVRHPPALVNAGAILTWLMFNLGYIVLATRDDAGDLVRWIFIAAAILPLLMCLVVLRSAFMYPRVVATILLGALSVFISQAVYFMETSGAFQKVPLIGPEGPFYFSNLDDFFFNTGLCMVLTGLLHCVYLAAQNRRRLQWEKVEKERALIDTQLIAHQLEERQRELRQVIDTVPHMIFARDRDGVILLANRAYAEAFGTTVDDLVGKIHRSQDSEIEFEPFIGRGTAQGSHDAVVEEHDAVLNGVTRNIQTIKIPYVSRKAGSEAMLGVAIDVTSQKNAEQELHHRIELEMLAASISTRLVNLAPEKTESEINLALRRVGKLLNVDRAYISLHEMNFTNVAQMEWCAPGVPSFCQSTLEVPIEKFAWGIRQFSGGQSIVIGNMDEFPPEAWFERRWHEWQCCRAVITVPIFVEKQYRGYIGLDLVREERAWPAEYESMLRLIGEVLWNAWTRMKYEHQRNAMERQIRESQKLESLGVLASGVAHDFNNLLLSVLGNVDLLRYRELVLEGGENNLRNIETAARQAADLCRQMLAVAGKGQVIIEPINIGQLALEMQSLLGVTVPKNVTLTTKIEPSLNLIEGDASQVRQILLNLISNAAEAMQGSKGEVKVHLFNQYCETDFLRESVMADSLPEGDYVCIEVDDSGAGMSEEALKRIFEPFFSTKAPGRGLGLAAVLGIVRGHQGALKLRSSLGQGTTFSLYFPTMAARQVEAAVPSTNLEDWRGEGEILLLDDKEYLISVCSGMLERLGYSVSAVNTVSEALDLLEGGGELAGALVDSGILGVETDDRLEEFQRLLGDRPLVLSSGFGEGSLAEAFREGYYDGFIQKPFQFSELRTTFHTVFQTRGVKPD